MAAVGVRVSFAVGAVLAVVLAALVPPVASDIGPEPLQADEWPMYGATADHAFSNAGAPPPKLGLVWSLAGNATLGTAVAAGGFVYIADVDTTSPPAGPNLVVHKLVAENGSIGPGTGAWGVRVVVPGAYALGPSRALAVAGDKVYALFTVNHTASAEYQDVLAILDVATGASSVFTGTARWTGTPAAATSAPIVSGGFVVFGSQDGSVYALTAATGALAWWFPTGAPVQTVPAVVEDIVYVTANETLYFLDLQGLADGDQGPAESGGWTGDELHRVAAGAPVTASPVVTDSYVYLAVAGDLWAIDRRFGGAAVWSHATPHATEGTPAIAGDFAVARRSDGRVYAFHRATGQIEWVRGTLRAPVGGEDMAAADGRVFLTARNGTSFDLVTLDAADGSVVDRNATASRARLGAPIVAGDLVLVAEGPSLLAFRGQPDLAVFASDVAMNLGPADGNVARGNVSASVRNNGDEPVYGVRVRVYDGDEATGTLLGEETVGTAEKPLGPGSRTTVNTADRDWSIGRHAITVVVDRAATETNTENNKAVAFVYVQAGPSPPPQVLGAGPYWVALLLGFLVGLAVLYLPIRRVRELRRKELEKP